MKIELVLGENPITGDREAWLKVMSDEVIDLPDALGALSEGQGEVLNDFCVWDNGFTPRPTPLQYFIPAPSEKDGSHRFEDWWLFGEKSTAKNNRLRENA